MLFRSGRPQAERGARLPRHRQTAHGCACHRSEPSGETVRTASRPARSRHRAQKRHRARRQIGAGANLSGARERKGGRLWRVSGEPIRHGRRTLAARSPRHERQTVRTCPRSEPSGETIRRGTVADCPANLSGEIATGTASRNVGTVAAELGTVAAGRSGTDRHGMSGEPVRRDCPRDRGRPSGGEIATAQAHGARLRLSPSGTGGEPVPVAEPIRTRPAA